MQFAEGMIVRSKAGHDKGSFFVVLRTENDVAYIIDGKSRTVRNPKKKKLIHLSPTKTVVDQRLMEADIEIRRILTEFNCKLRNS